MEQEQKEKEKEKDSVSLLPTVAPTNTDSDTGNLCLFIDNYSNLRSNVTFDMNSQCWTCGCVGLEQTPPVLLPTVTGCWILRCVYSTGTWHSASERNNVFLWKQ